MFARVTVTVQPVFEGSHDHTWKVEFEAQMLDMTTRSGHVENIVGSYEETVDTIRQVLKHLIDGNLMFCVPHPELPGHSLPLAIPILSATGVRS